MKNAYRLSLTALMLAGIAASSQAASIPPVPRPLARDESDALTVFNPNGTIFNRLAVLERLEVPGQPYFFGDLSLANPGQFGLGTALSETASTSTLSDRFGVVSFAGFFFLGFTSDGETGLPGGPSTFLPTNTIVVEGAYQDATKYLNPALQAQGYTATFQSDAEAVPEPASLTLLSLGGVGLATYLRRRRLPV